MLVLCPPDSPVGIFFRPTLANLGLFVFFAHLYNVQFQYSPINMKKKLFIKASLAMACFSLALLVAGCELIDNFLGEDHALTIQI